MTKGSDDLIEAEIDALVKRLEPPIRRTHEATFSTLIMTYNKKIRGDKTAIELFRTHSLVEPTALECMCKALTS